MCRTTSTTQVKEVLYDGDYPPLRWLNDSNTVWINAFGGMRRPLLWLEIVYRIDTIPGDENRTPVLGHFVKSLLLYLMTIGGILLNPTESQ